MIIRKPSQDELRSTVRAFIKKAGYVVKTCYNGKDNICVMDKYYANCQFLSKRSLQWPLKEVVYVDSSGRFHIRQTAKLDYILHEGFYKR